MKKLLYVIIFHFTLWGGSIAQTTVSELQSAIAEANNIKTKVSDARRASNQLAKHILLAGVASPTAFEVATSTATNAMQDHVDNIQYHVNQALTLSNNGFSATRIFQTATQVNAQIGTIDGIRSQIVIALQTQNEALAQQLLSTFNAALSRQNTLANQVITRINQAIEVVRPYQVCVRTVDSHGNLVAPSDLYGFYCVKTGTYELVEPSNQEGTCWTLPAGTYEFGSFPGYWSGTSSNVITLSRSMEVNGIITVDLVFWSE